MRASFATPLLGTSFINWMIEVISDTNAEKNLTVASAARLDSASRCAANEVNL